MLLCLLSLLGRCAYYQRYIDEHDNNCRKCQLETEASNLQREAENITATFYEKLLPECRHMQRGVVYDLIIPEMLALQRDAILILAQVCVPQDLTVRTNFASEWRNDQGLSSWRKHLELISVLGATRQKFQSTKHVLEHATFIVNNNRDTVLLLHNQPVNASLVWCVKGLTYVKTTDEQYVSLQPFIASWEHDENMVIASKSSAHPALNLLEFEAFGQLRAGFSLQLPRLLRVIEQRTLSFQRQGVVDVLMALLWQAGPPSKQKLALDALLPREVAESDEWLRMNLQILNTDFAEKLCKHMTRLLTHSEDNWSNDKVLLCMCHVARCVAEHSQPGRAAGPARPFACVHLVVEVKAFQ